MLCGNESIKDSETILVNRDREAIVRMQLTTLQFVENLNLSNILSWSFLNCY
jgi:hypothetical protein